MQASTLVRIKRPGARVDWLTTSSDIRSRQICRKRKRGRNRSRCFDNAVERRKGGDKREDRKAGTTLRLIFHYFYFSPSGKRGAALIRHAGARRGCTSPSSSSSPSSFSRVCPFSRIHLRAGGKRGGREIKEERKLY